jgi:L-fuconolactonase
MQNIIDTHMHIFDLNQFRVLWLEDTDTLDKPIVLKDYLKAVSTNSEYKVIGCEHVELDTIEEQKKAENDYFVSVVNDSDTLVSGITIYAPMESNDLDSFLTPYVNEPNVKGVRYILHVPSAKKGTCLQPQFIENVKLLGSYNLIFEACLRAEELDDFYELAKKCPETEFVLNHMGLFDMQNIDDALYVKKFKKDISDISKLDNVSVKVSGLSSSCVSEIDGLVNHTFDSFGEDRIMFASNYPVCTLNLSFDDWTRAMLSICEGRSQIFKDKFFYLNAIKIYKMKGIKND